MTTRGLAAEIEALMAGGGDGGGDEAEQLELIEIMGLSPVAELREATRGLEPRGPGRPPGAKSRKNLDVVRLVKATRRPIYLALRDIADTPVHELARMLGCSRKEAFDRWLAVAKHCDAVENGTPIQRVDVTSQGQQLPMVMFADLPVPPELVNGNPPIEGEAREVVDFTGVSEGEGDQVSRAKSHDEAITLLDQGLGPGEPAD